MNLLNDINSPDVQSVTFNSQKGHLTKEIVQEKSRETLRMMMPMLNILRVSVRIFSSSHENDGNGFQNRKLHMLGPL